MNRSLINSKTITVNSGAKITRIKLFFFLFLLLTISAGCGFKINRNQPMLPNNASSIALYKIENQTSIPALDTTLRQELESTLSANRNIRIRGVDGADMVLSVNIISSSYSKTELSLTTTQYYEYSFTTTAQLSLYNNRKQEDHFKNVSISGTYKINSSESDLDSSTVEEHYFDSLEELSKSIYSKITSEF